MSYLVLARKYRPQRFEDVVGQTHVTRTLSNAISADRVAHALLFSGPRGTGKTTVARILAKALNCQKGPTPTPCNECPSCKSITESHAVDVFEIDGASNNSVDQVRELRENVRYMPAQSRLKIYIIDEVHMLSPSAFNALLKTLEEPPAHVMFMFATTEPHKIPITVLSRCQRHDFRRIDAGAIAGHLKEICRQEGVESDEEALWLIAREAGGSMRDALSLLDQVMSGAEGALRADRIPEILGVVDRQVIFAISAAILKQDLGQILDLVNDVYDQGIDLKKLYGDLLSHFRNLLVIKLGRDADRLVDLPAHEVETLRKQADDCSALFLNQIFDLLFREEASIRFSAQPRLVLEMMFIRLGQMQPALSIDELIGKLDRLRAELAGGGSDPSPGDSGGGRSGPSPPAGSADDSAADDGSARAMGGGQVAADPADLWGRFVAQISAAHPALGTSLQQGGRLRRLDENRFEIEIQGNGFSRNLVKRRKNRDILHQAMAQLLGEPVEVSVKTAGEEEKPKMRRKQEIEKLKKEALHHPLVADAVEIFDGKIIDVELLQEVKE
ncbi:MAG: DNA polymerase III subunit gamma/tau [Desulfobacterales bacterium]|jgi:DNA polymerase-3 subunit gamma/tau